MSKIKSVYYCQKCGFESVKWLGKCPSCNEWNTFVEEIVSKDRKNTFASVKTDKIKLLHEINVCEQERFVTKDEELNRVLGGGIVPGSLILFGGEPGIGKSTLMLQTALQNKWRVLYISGEESEQQILLRAKRLPYQNKECYIVNETVIQNIIPIIEHIQPQLVIVDSIQTLTTNLLESAPGSVSQVRECTAEIMRLAKTKNIPFFIIGHITKDGTLAGPKVLEHMVDTVLQFEGDQHYLYRILRTTKNRFGSTNEIGIYEMQGMGLRQVSNPSEILINHREEDVSGVAIASVLEGNRPLMIETQALVTTSAYATAQRSSTGFDLRRLAMLLAVLEKKYGLKLYQKDVFVNIAGGLKVEDPATDLALAVAITSSNYDIPISQKFCFCAEIGLTGEIRPVNRIDQRISEAEKLGFQKIFIAQNNFKSLTEKSNKIEIIGVNKLEQLFQKLFKG
ncbi:MAG: DNA repair protein RadA [Bacteroidia bacterium]|nr:MAG: DNA repair protein RadA [Bacteroidia bacterium]